MSKFHTIIFTGLATASLLSVTTVAAAQEWYEGGTLHTSKLSEWAAAPQANRVATAADFGAGITNKSGKPFKNQVEMRLVALELTLCIDDVAKEVKLGSQETASIAVLCAQQLQLM